MLAPTRDKLRAHTPLRFYAGRNATKADIYLWEEGGTRLAVKDYAHRPPWIRLTLGRCLIKREVRAYDHLKNLAGIPRFAGQIDPLAFAVEFIDGRDLSHFRPGEVSADFFQKLIQLIHSVHQAGVAQGDIHHRDVLVGPEGGPYLVDFSTALFRAGNPGSLRQRLFLAACSSDRRAILKLKNRHFPGSLTEAEKLELSQPPGWYRIGKLLRRWLRPGRGNRGRRKR